MTILDWCAFTRPIQYTEEQPFQNTFMRRVMLVTAAFHDLMPAVMQHAAKDLVHTTPQRPYRQAWACPNVGWHINADWKRKEALIVFNGSACEMLRQIGPAAIRQVLLLAIETGTRLDLATDIETALSVRAVEKAGWAKKIRSTSFISSQTGDTLYIGSRSSGAFARVYRYADPHPRHALLRIEHEMKKEQARSVAQIAAVHGIETAQRSVAAKFSYKHPEIKEAFEGDVERIVTERHERTLAKTEIWLMTQAAPAFQRLVAEGVIDDPAAWVKKHMLGNA